MQHIIGIHNPSQTNIIKINPLASIWVPTKTSISLFLKLSIIFSKPNLPQVILIHPPNFCVRENSDQLLLCCGGFRRMERRAVNPRNGFYVYDTLNLSMGDVTNNRLNNPSVLK
jgi:hypothetical protein